MKTIDGSYNGYTTQLAKCVEIRFIDESPQITAIRNHKSEKPEECPIVQFQQMPLFAELTRIRNLLVFFRLAFYIGIPKLQLVANQIIWIAVLICQIMATAAFVYSIRSHEMESRIVIFTLARCFQNLQSIMAMVFVYYWQRKGSFIQYVKTLHEAQESAGCIKYQNYLGRIVHYLYGVVAIGFGFYILIQCTIFFEINVEIFNPEFHKTLQQNKFLIIPTFILMCYSMVCTSVAMFLYCIFTYGSVLEIRYFNERLQNIGKDGEGTILEELMKLINDHAKLSEAIRKLDSMCEVFAFVMIGSTIPITVFSMLQLLTTKGLPPINLIVCLPMVFFCIALLTALTAIPATLHNVLDRSKHHLYENTKIWQTFDKHVFQVANSLAAHLNQPDLGVSVWGFAVVSKPLILTTISVMVTCMAFLLELRKRPHI